jgi:hypothetical protein
MRLTSTDFVFNPDDFRDAKFIDGGELDSDQLNDGEVIIAVDRLALTANTISYGIAGKSGLIRYLESFPTDAPYARMPFWGFWRYCRLGPPRFADRRAALRLLPAIDLSAVPNGSCERGVLPGYDAEPSQHSGVL